MPIIVDELLDSRNVITGAGQNPSAELHYFIQGTDSEIEARNELTAIAPVTYDLFGNGIFFLPRSHIVISPMGDKLWEGILRYEVVPQAYQSEFSFDTGGGTQHITHSIETVGMYAPSEQTAPDHMGAIGVTRDGVEGVDIAVPVYEFAETHYFPEGFVTPTYKATLFALTGLTNYNYYKGFAPGECLFLGASGAKRGNGDWGIHFRFAASPDATDIVIGGITVAFKGGWDYLWVRHADEVDEEAKALVKRPVAVYVERVYRRGDLALLGIGA